MRTDRSSCNNEALKLTPPPPPAQRDWTKLLEHNHQWRSTVNIWKCTTISAVWWTCNLCTPTHASAPITLSKYPRNMQCVTNEGPPYISLILNCIGKHVQICLQGLTSATIIYPILGFHPRINIWAHIMRACTISTTTLNHPPPTTVPVLHAHLHTCAHTRWIAIYNVCTWQYRKNVCGTEYVLFLLQHILLIFSRSFLRPLTHSLPLAYTWQQPYSAHDKLSVPILNFSPSGYKWPYI